MTYIAVVTSETTVSVSVLAKSGTSVSVLVSVQVGDIVSVSAKTEKELFPVDLCSVDR